jgi:hypothetical protein
LVPALVLWCDRFALARRAQARRIHSADRLGHRHARQSFIAFTLVALALLAAAIWVVANQRETSVVATGGAPVFPDMQTGVNKAPRSTSSISGTLTIKRSGDDWSLVEKQGYRRR